MKQSEKLDLILKRLYDLRNERNKLTLKAIMQNLSIYESDEEMHRLADRLKFDGLANVNIIAAGRVLIQIKSHGIEYCEENSYSQPGMSLTSFNFNINGDISGSNIMMTAGNISHVKQSIKQKNESSEIIRKIKELTLANNEIENEKKEQILECANDMEDKINAGKPISKYQSKSLLDISAGFAQLVSLGIQLAQISGITL